MKRNQLLGMLALMLAMGMTFPAPTVAEDEKQPKLSGTTVTDANGEIVDTGMMLSEGALEISDTDEAVFVTPETTRVTLLSSKEKDKDDDEDGGQDKDSGEDGHVSSSSTINSSDGELESVCDPNSITSAATLLAAIESGETQITLENDICLEHNLEINRDELILNLNGHKIITLKPNMRVLDVKRGDVSIIGPGEIIAYGEGSVAVRVYGALTQDMPAYAKVTIGEEVSLYAPTSYGIIVSPNAINTAYGVEINLKGKVIAHDGLCINGLVRSGERAPIINIADNAEVTADGESGTAIYTAGYGTWNIGKATISGATGLGIKAGQLNFINTEVSATGAYREPEAWSNGLNEVGAALQIENNDAYQDHISIKIEGGKYTSANSYAVFSYNASGDTENQLQQLSINKSMFSEVAISGQLGVFNPEFVDAQAQGATVIKSGQFNSDVSAFLAPELELNVGEDGLYHVVGQSEEQLLAETRASLTRLLDTVKQIPAEEYTEESYQNLAVAIKNGEDLLSDETTDRARLLSAIEEIEHAQAALELKPAEPVDPEPDPNPELTAAKTALREKLASLAELRAEDYTVESYRVLADAMEAAESLLANEDATKVALEASLHVLDAAEQALIAAPVVNPDPGEDDDPIADEAALIEAKLRLSEALDAVRDLRPEDFEDGFDFGALELLISRAEIILEDDDATMTDLRDVTHDLMQALDFLKEGENPPLPDIPSDDDPSDDGPSSDENFWQGSGSQNGDSGQPAPGSDETLDWSALRDVINDISKLDADRYTSSSYNRLLNELARARALIGSDQATQAAIDDVVFELNLAILGLELAPNVQPTELPNGQGSNTTTNPGSPDTGAARGSEDFSAKVATSSILASFAAAAAAGLAAYRRNRRMQK